jgi:Fe-Mn family superoxide dismutase
VFKLPALPYAHDALSPTISAETMRLHHDKHHAKYVQTVNELCRKEGLRPESLEDLVIQAHAAGKSKLYNNAAQAWNHAFFWSCMTPSKTAPEAALARAIDEAFGSMDALMQTFVGEGESHFGSGWVWLLAGRDGLTVKATHDASNPLAEQGVTPLIACDLWEHAYYVDYKNDREGFLKAWFESLPDWTFAGHQLKAAEGEGQAWRHPAPDSSEPLRRQA